MNVLRLLIAALSARGENGLRAQNSQVKCSIVIPAYERSPSMSSGGVTPRVLRLHPTAELVPGPAAFSAASNVMDLIREREEVSDSRAQGTRVQGWQFCDSKALMVVGIFAYIGPIELFVCTT